MCVFWFICLFLVLLPRQLKLSCHDLQMNVAAAGGWLGLEFGEYPTVNIYFFTFHLKTQGKKLLLCNGPFTISSYITKTYF